MAVAEQLRELQAFIEESWIELQKVTWPTWEELRSATIVVIIFTVLVSLIIWIMDAFSSWLVGLIMGIFGA